MKPKFLFLPFFLLAIIACASTEQDALEDAQFALDRGDYTEAITAATEALTANPANTSAVRILSSAYFGRSGIDFLDLAEVITDLDASAGIENFTTVANALPDDSDLDDLRSAIETLENFSGIDATTYTDEVLADAAFDVGIMQIVEQYALGVFGSNFTTSFDASLITEAQAGSALDDFINFDNRLIASGVDETETFIEAIRQNFCVLKSKSAGDGFTLGEYQALVHCQLTSNIADSFDTSGFTSSIATCGDINPDNATLSSAIDSCLGDDTSL